MNSKISNFLWRKLMRRIKKQPAKESLRELLELDNELYKEISQEALRFGNGLHPKHWLTKYHDFFVKNIEEGEVIFDVGCGNGALTYDVAKKTGAKVIGIDLNENNIAVAKKEYQLPNIQFIKGDALKFEEIPELEGVKIDVVVLSNILEHLEKRVGFLSCIKQKINPKKVLLRVPMFEREWMVPMKKELEVNHILDATHYIEYTQEEFFGELKVSGFQIQFYEIRWGEIYAVAV